MFRKFVDCNISGRVGFEGWASNQREELITLRQRSTSTVDAGEEKRGVKRQTFL